jgi:hypothetical protein
MKRRQMIERRIASAERRMDKAKEEREIGAYFAAALLWVKACDDEYYIRKPAKEWVNRLQATISCIDAMLEDEKNPATASVLNAAWREATEDLLATIVTEGGAA